MNKLLIFSQRNINVSPSSTFSGVLSKHNTYIGTHNAAIACNVIQMSRLFYSKYVTILQEASVFKFHAQSIAIPF